MPQVLRENLMNWRKAASISKKGQLASPQETSSHDISITRCGTLAWTSDMKDCYGSGDLHRCRCRYGWYSLCPTRRTSFIDLVLQTPPSWLSKPSKCCLMWLKQGRKNELTVFIILFIKYNFITQNV